MILTKKELEKKGWIFLKHAGGAHYAVYKNLGGKSVTAKTLLTLRKKLS
jgi:hypothetical protein